MAVLLRMIVPSRMRISNYHVTYTWCTKRAHAQQYNSVHSCTPEASPTQTNNAPIRVEETRCIMKVLVLLALVVVATAFEYTAEWELWKRVNLLLVHLVDL